jgi:DNA repair protein RadC
MTTNQIVISNDDAIIESALKILESRISYSSASPPLTSPQASKDYVRLQLATFEHEVFACVFMDNRNRVITFEKLFRGTIDGASVYPREVVKACLSHNAAAVILAHNHPSGVAEPSQADIRITERLKKALALVDIRVLDHLIVGEEVISFAERGLL